MSRVEGCDIIGISVLIWIGTVSFAPIEDIAHSDPAFAVTQSGGCYVDTLHACEHLIGTDGFSGYLHFP
jgi:hypothetical protein